MDPFISVLHHNRIQDMGQEEVLATLRFLVLMLMNEIKTAKA